MKKFNFKIRGNSFETSVLSFEENIVEIQINGTNYTVEIDKTISVSKTPKLMRSAVHTAPGEGFINMKPTNVSTLKSPLPGTIFRINVKVGDKVKLGDVLLILEAMKMENNIMSEKAGTVKSILVKEGAAVMQDAPLIEFE
jgi:biotin carboxyl carrier protein